MAEALALTPVAETAPVGLRKVPLDRSPAHVYLASLAPGSRPAVRHALNRIASLLTSGRERWDTLDWAAVRYQHCQAVRAVLAEKYASTGASHSLSCLRSVLREAWNLELMSAEDYQRAASVKSVRGQTPPAGRALSGGEIAALFASCQDDSSAARGSRDAAVLATLYQGGTRRAEAAALSLEDFVEESGELTVKKGKGAKARVVYLSGGGLEALSAWLSHRGRDPGPLFCRVGRWGEVRLHRGHLSPSAIAELVQRRAKRAGVAHFSAHDLRRTFVGDLLDRGADISCVQGLCGHSSVSTTQRYDRRPAAARRKAASLIHVPFVRTAPTP